MENFDETDEPVVRLPVGRKRGKQPEAFARNKKKMARHSGGGCFSAFNCGHNMQGAGLCMAGSLVDTDLTFMHSCLYETCDKVKQDAVLLSYMNIEGVKRRRIIGDQERKRNRDFAVKYFVMKENQEQVPVCKASFMSIFSK